jgi:hypothetical protein
VYAYYYLLSRVFVTSTEKDARSCAWSTAPTTTPPQIPDETATIVVEEKLTSRDKGGISKARPNKPTNTT